MHTFAAARRPKTVYGRIRGVHRSHRRRRESDSSYEEESASQSSRQSSKHDYESSEDETKAVEAELCKENERSAVRTTEGKGKATAKINGKRKPMQQKSINCSAKIPTRGDADEKELDDSDDAIVCSPQRRRGIASRPIVICSSPAGSSSSSSYRSVPRAVALSDSEVDESVQELTHRIHKTRIREEDSAAEHSLDALLASCDVSEIILFDDALDSVQALAGASTWKKIGEATYSEVYSVPGSNMVLKVIPLSTDSPEDPDGSFPQPERSSPVDVQREVSMTRALSDTHRTFVTLHRASVVRGAYPARLLEAWDEKRKEKKDQNARPDMFSDDSLFCLLVLSDGGCDLESFRLASWSQAAGVIAQVAQALATAEEECGFEHRDLHWGNVVIKEAKKGRVGKFKSLGITLLTSSRWSGVQATIIDFTLSRAVFDDKLVVYHPLDDEVFFKGEGDIQFDVYRAMRRETGEHWQAFHAYTNVLWMRYLLAKVIDAKDLRSVSSADTEDELVDIEAECCTVLRSLRRVLDNDVERDSVEAREIVNVRTFCDRMASMLQPEGDL